MFKIRFWFLKNPRGSLNDIPSLASQWQSSGWPACQEIDAENGQVHRNIFSSLTCLWSQWTFNLIRDGDGDLSEQEFVDGAVEQVVQVQIRVQEYIELDGAMKYARENIQRKYSSTSRVTQKSGENLFPGWAPGQTGEDCEKGRGTSLPDVYLLLTSNLFPFYTFIQFLLKINLATPCPVSDTNVLCSVSTDKYAYFLPSYHFLH